jgi:hypothetical protein
MELIRDFAKPLPVMVISDLLAIPMDMHADFVRWSHDLAQSFNSLSRAIERRADKAAAGFRDYLRPLIRERAANPGTDLISALIAASDHETGMTEEELIANCGFMFIAGHETTTHLIANGLLTLLQHPAQLDRIFADPALIPSAVEELLRFAGPVQLTSRFALADVEMCGHEIRRGQALVLPLAAANRDPAQFADPNSFEVGREDNNHLAFGGGPHYCLGAQLARMQAEIALSTMLRRFPRVALTSAPLEWQDTVLTRGLVRLELTLRAAR